jgi:hypothetical protein
MGSTGPSAVYCRRDNSRLARESVPLPHGNTEMDWYSSSFAYEQIVGAGYAALSGTWDKSGQAASLMASSESFGPERDPAKPIGNEMKLFHFPLLPISFIMGLTRAYHRST